MRDDLTCYPVPSLLGYCRCLQGVVCLSFLALVSISCHLNLYTHKTEAGLASPSQPEQRPQQLQQPQAQTTTPEIVYNHFCNTMNVPYGRSRNAFEWTLWLENTQVSGAASSNRDGLGLGPEILDGKWLAFTVNMNKPELCFCFKDFSRGTSWWFCMTIWMITQTPRTTILVYQISHFRGPITKWDP